MEIKIRTAKVEEMCIRDRISAAVLSVLSATAGILISILAGTPVGSTIVAVDIAVFLISYGIGRITGR